MSYHKHWNVLIGKQLLEMNTEWFLDCMCLQHLTHSVARCPYCTRSCDMEPGAGVGFTIQGLSFQQEVSIAAAVALGCSPSIRRDHLRYQQLLPVEEIIWETSDYQKYDQKISKIRGVSLVQHASNLASVIPCVFRDASEASDTFPAGNHQAENTLPLLEVDIEPDGHVSYERLSKKRGMFDSLVPC